MINYKKAVERNKEEIFADRFTPEMIAFLVSEWQRKVGLLDDGICGKATQASLEHRLNPTRPIAMGRVEAEAVWTKWDGPLRIQPRKRADVYATFGNPGAGSVDPEWERKNIITVRDLPGVPSKWYFQCHKLIEPYLREALRRAMLVDDPYVIERAASFVFRHMRHNSTMPLSYHSFGIAVDFNPQENFSKRFKKGQAPKPWSDEWNATWPNGVTREFVAAMQSCGFTWGADWDSDGDTSDHTYIDPMHFEWVDHS